MLLLQKRQFYLSFFLLSFLIFPAASFAFSCPSNLPPMQAKEIYSPDEQTSLLCYLKEVLEQRHAGNVYSNFKTTTESYFNTCAREISDHALNQAEANGLLKKCLAQFNNGHISVELRNTVPVRLPFQILRSEGKHLVKSTFPQESCRSENSVQRGDEILAIDSMPITELVDDLLPFQSKSSQLARVQSAVDALTKRNYHYPEGPKAHILIKRNGQNLTVTENYYYFKDRYTDSQVQTLKNNNVAECIRDLSRPHRGRGFYFSRSLYPSSWTAFTDLSRNKEIASFSRGVEDLPQNTCYVRLLNFNEDEVVLDSGESIDLWEQIEVDIDQCKYDQAKLILDVRANRGGAYRRLERILNLLVPSHRSHELEYRSLRVEHSFSGDFHCALEDFTQGFEGLDLQAFSSNICQTLDFDPMWLEGYAQDIVVLTSPLCKSSCDLLARTLKPLPNTTFLGTPTEGAFNGVSFYQRQGLSTLPYSSFVSIYFDDVTTMVREDFNANDSRLFCDPQGDYCYRPIEGDAVNPHIFYEPTLEDMTLRPFWTSLRSKIRQILSTEKK
jgi:C-terminal processing protease CtpA/Prc